MWFTLSGGSAEWTTGCVVSQGGMDLFMTDLQTHGHRQQLLTDEGEKELILSPNPKQANYTCCQHFIAYKLLILWFLVQRMKTKQM